VVLDGRTPTALPLKERALSEEDGYVLRVPPERSRELGLRGVRVPEVDQRVSETQDGPRVVRSDLEDGAKQKDGLVRMAVSPQLFRLLHDLSRFRRLETKRVEIGRASCRER